MFETKRTHQPDSYSAGAEPDRMEPAGLRKTPTTVGFRGARDSVPMSPTTSPESEDVTVLAASVRNRPDMAADTSVHKTQTDHHWLLGLNMDFKGKRVGPYRLERLLGNGGMGSVFLAIRDDDQFQMKVALKMVRPDLDRDVFIRRFLHERQILADLKHPNIARLLDGGTTSEGLPYLVMEYVEGRPIDRYCREQGLSMRERLALFLKVGGAVDFIHRNQILHRDIKPGNILVTEAGEPVLLDFGIAKILDPATETPRTCTGSFFLTPQYASPEQFLGERLGPQSDVYALGVLLYELLTGRLPHELQGGSLGDYRRIVCDQEPVKPSRAQNNPGEISTDSQHSKSTGLVPDRDLDAVLLKALRKEPQHRYATLALFTADLERYLQGYPVLARGSAWRYRAHKLFRRHRRQWVTALSFGVMLLGFYGFLCCWKEDLAESRREAERQGQIAQQALEERSQMEVRAEVERAEAELARGVVRQTLGEIKAERDRARKAWMALKQGEPRSVDKASTGIYPVVTKSAGPTLDQLTREREQAQRALIEVKRSLAVAEQHRRLAQQERDISARLLGFLEEIVTDPQEEAVSAGWILDRCPELQGQGQAGRIRLQARLMNLAGSVYLSLARYGDALPLLEYGLQLRQEGSGQEGSGLEALGQKRRDYSADLQRVGRLYAGLGFYERAAQLYIEALQNQRAAFGRNHPQVAEAAVYLAELAWAMGNAKKAVSLMQVAVNSVRAACGSGSEEVAAYVRRLTYYCCDGAQPGSSPSFPPRELWRDFLEDEDAALNDVVEALGQILPLRNQPPAMADFNPPRPAPPTPSATESSGSGGRNGRSSAERGAGGQVARADRPSRNRGGKHEGSSSRRGIRKNDNGFGRRGSPSDARGFTGRRSQSGGKSGGGHRH